MAVKIAIRVLVPPTSIAKYIKVLYHLLNCDKIDKDMGLLIRYRREVFCERFQRKDNNIKWQMPKN